MLGRIGGMRIVPQMLTSFLLVQGFPSDVDVYDTVVGNIPMIILFGIPMKILHEESQHVYILMIFPSSQLRFHKIPWNDAQIPTNFSTSCHFGGVTALPESLNASWEWWPWLGIESHPWLWKPQDVSEYRIVFLEIFWMPNIDVGKKIGRCCFRNPQASILYWSLCSDENNTRHWWVFHGTQPELHLLVLGISKTNLTIFNWRKNIWLQLWGGKNRTV